MAFFQHLSIKLPGRSDPVVPVVWSDNEVTLWPGESLAVTARISAVGSAMPVVEVSGWNVPTQTVQVSTDSGAH